MSYTKHMIKDSQCNYLNFENQSSHMMLLSCINFDNSNVTNNCNGNVNQSTVNGQGILEGFSSDMGISGVSYVPDGECPVGFTKVGDQCHQLCRGCNYTDKKGVYGDRYLPDFNICGVDGLFSGIDMNGQIKCKPNPLKNNDSLNDNIFSFFLY